MTLDLRSKYATPPGDAVELRAFTHGLMPRSVPTMMHHFADDWRERGVDAWNEVPNHWLPESGDTVGWWILPEYLGDQFVARLISAPPGTCIMQPNVHWTVNTLFSDVERFRGKRIVLTADAFPSVLQPACRWAELAGFDLTVVPPRDDGFVDQLAVLRAIGNDTAAVVLNHVGFTTGERLPDAFLQETSSHAHRFGALLVVDGYHAVGSMPIRVQDTRIDVYVGGLLKEASGSSGNAFVYIREGLDLRPQLTGWFGHEDAFAFNQNPVVARDVRRRFLGGTTAVASLYHAVEGARVLLEEGVGRVRTDSLAKSAFCLEQARASGLKLHSPVEDERRSALVVLEIEGADLVSASLKGHGIFTDSRLGRYLRLAPFVWNTVDELERALDLIAKAARQKGIAPRSSDQSNQPVP